MIKINNKIKIGYNSEPLIITEISGNHGGNKQKFLGLIRSACENGADLVKIQTYEPEDITLNIKNNSFKIKKGIWKNKYLWDLYKEAHTPYSWHKEAFEITKKYNKILFSSPFSKRAVDFLEKFKVPIYKIASFEITDIKLINYIASKKKPIIISTGMASDNEIKKAIKEINKFHNKIIILHCVSSYPTKLEDTNLIRISKLKSIYKKNLIGLSDHTDDIISSIAAVPLKIVAIEKHYKLNKNDKSPDASFSITPSQLKELKKNVLSIHKALSLRAKSKDVSNKILRRSIFSTVDINKNEKITKKNIDTLRPKVGIPAEYYFDVLGKKTKSKINKFQPIFFKDLK